MGFILVFLLSLYSTLHLQLFCSPFRRVHPLLWACTPSDFAIRLGFGVRHLIIILISRAARVRGVRSTKQSRHCMHESLHTQNLLSFARASHSFSHTPRSDI